MTDSLTITEAPERTRRRSSWNPPVIPEWNQPRSSFPHLRDSLLKDDVAGAATATGLNQSEIQTKRNLFEALKSPRLNRDLIYNNVVPHKTLPPAKKPKPLPRPRQRGISASSQDIPHNSATSQSEYVLPWHPDVSSSSIFQNKNPHNSATSHSSDDESDYLDMKPITPAASPNKEKQIGLPNSQTDDTFLNKIIDGHLICTICNKRYDKPKMLKCSHSFCSHCLSEKIQHQKPPTGTITCPICAEVTPIPGNGVNGLQDSTLLQAIIDDVSKHESCRVGQRSDDTFFLQEESQKSSNEKKIHRVQCRSVKTYEVISRKTERPLEPFLRDHSTKNLTDHSTRNLTKCLQHPNHDVTHFCKTCERLICSDCMQSDVHVRHQYVDVALAEEHGKTIMKVLLDYVKEKKVEYVKSVSSLEDAYCRLHSMIRGTKKKIADQERYQMEKIKEQSAALQEEATRFGNERAEKIEEQHKKHCEAAESASNNQDILEHAISKAGQLEVLLAKEDVINKCNKTLMENIPKPMHKLSFLDFTEAQEDSTITMGQLLQTERWELQEKLVAGDEEPFQLTGYIAMYTNGDIAVTDMLNWQLKVLRQDDKRCTRIEKSDKALFNPFAVAINKKDHLLVIDQNKVKVFDNEVKFLFEVPSPFPQTDENTVPSIVTCLAVDKQNRIAIGNRGKKAVSLHQPDGKLMRVLNADLIDTQMTTTNAERIIYSNYRESKLVSMDYKGNIVFCVSTGDKKPTGVCCDSIGFIYAAVHSMIQGTCQINHYNRTGEFIGCMVEGLYNPLGMIFTPRDKLAVADKDSVKIYRRV